MRYANLGKRDKNEPEVFQALKIAGCDPERLTDVDIVAKHVDGSGHLIEVKIPGQEQSLTKIQRRLKDIFGDKFHVVSNAESALSALGKL